MRHIINKLFVILMALIIGTFVCPMESEPSEVLFGWTPFEIKKNLVPGFRNGDNDSELIRYFLDKSKFAGKGEVNKQSIDISEKADTNWNEFDLRYFKIYLSSVGRSEKKKAGWSQQYASQVDKLGMVKALPSMLGDTPVRETFESLGKIIEPQIKVGISF